MKPLQAKVAGTVLLLMCLTACGQGQVAAPQASPSSTAPQTATSASASTPTATAQSNSSSPSESPSCSSTVTAEQAIAEATATLGEPMQGPDVRWGNEQAEISGFDACQELSWIILPIVPNETMAEQLKPDFAGLNRLVLFHQGRFIDHNYDILNGETPTVTRQGSNQLTVVYAQYGQSYTSVYTWNAAANRLDHAGEVPPPTGFVSGPVAPPSATTTGISVDNQASRQIPSNAVEVPAAYDKGGSRIIKTPSGNIGCDLMGDFGAICTVSSYITDKKYPVYHEGWGTRYKYSFGITDSGMLPAPEVRGDPTYHEQYRDEAYAVPYGETVYYGSTVCESQEEGLTCWNVKTGYGVFMSREGYRTFSF